MEDWRTKPRVGRQAFMRHVDQISERLRNGETQKCIYDSLVENGFELSYKQFNSYVRRIILGSDSKSNPAHKPTIKKQVIESEKINNLPTKIRNPADLLRLRRKPIDLEELQNLQGYEDESSNS
ncbi:hypothetical protein F164LOC_18125 [Pectobacterium carotovorum]|uniref:TraK family protein n=1 Tax=Pectobacterium versatile TaxID=2488639 RepID=UPI000C7ECD17|nr:TraK family protein [Pectobacterium versatile]PLY35814.1 hypothetical protein F164LOC_18125 [Pectobacterium carotovorum]